MILAALMLMQAAYPPETEAVMKRSRQPARQQAAPAAAPLPPEVAAKLQVCVDTAINEPEAGLRFAADWAKDGGDFSALQCRGFSLSRQGKWLDAAQAYADAATLAGQSGSAPDAARLWAQAGNAALVGGDAARARAWFDFALGHALPDSLAKGEIHLDRARALVVLGDMAGARADLDLALKLAENDPLAWLLSATLARREGNMTRAGKEIAEAVRRSPDDAYVALEQGNIAMASGDEAGAKAAWQRVLTLAPDSEPAEAARQMLSQLDESNGTELGVRAGK